MPVVLPYDGSAPARSALLRLAGRTHEHWLRDRPLVLLVQHQRRTDRCRRRAAGSLAAVNLPLEIRQLEGADLRGALQRFASSVSDPRFVLALAPHGGSRWYRNVIAELLTGQHGRCLVLQLPARRPPHLLHGFVLTRRLLTALTGGRLASGRSTPPTPALPSRRPLRATRPWHGACRPVPGSDRPRLKEHNP